MDINQLPSSREAEEAVLGSILIYPQSYYEISKHIIADDFYSIRNQWIFHAIEKLIRGHIEVDMLTVSKELEDSGQLTEIGGGYLTKLVEATPSSLHAEDYAKVVLEKATRRSMLQSATKLANFAYDQGVEIETVIPEYINELLKNIRTENKTRHISSGLKELYDDIVARSNDPQTCFGLKTGIPTFDREFGGAQKGTCLILSGRPGSGKSIFKNQIAINMAKEGHPGVVYELEMSEKNSLRRLLSAEANVSARNMKTGNMVDSDWERVTKSFETMSELPIHISESTSWTTAGIMSDLTRLKAIYGIEWFTLDYIGLVKDRVGKDITEKDGIVTESLHDICKNLNMFGLLVQSMNKQGFKEDVDGGMEDVAGGAKTHHTAEIITVMVKSDPKNNPSHVDWKFKKNRDADTWIDVIRLQWRKGYPYFEERMMLP